MKNFQYSHFGLVGTELYSKHWSPEKLKQKVTVRTSKTGHGSHRSLLFSYKAILKAKKTAKLRGSQFSWLVRTIWSKFQNLDWNHQND